MKIEAGDIIYQSFGVNVGNISIYIIKKKIDNNKYETEYINRDYISLKTFITIDTRKIVDLELIPNIKKADKKLLTRIKREIVEDSFQMPWKKIEIK